MRQVPPSSFTRNSWQRGPIVGIGRDAGRGTVSPACTRRRSVPTSIRASIEKGGVLISPFSHTSGLSRGPPRLLIYVRYGIGSSRTVSALTHIGRSRHRL